MKSWTLELTNPYVVVTVSVHTDDPGVIADVERAAKANGLKLVPIAETTTSQFPRPRMSEIGRSHETLPLRGGEIA